MSNGLWSGKAPVEPTVLRFRSAVAHSYVQSIYDLNPDLASKGFLEQQEFLDGYHLPFTGGLAWSLNRLGLPTLDIVYDVPELQTAWERDTGEALTGDNRRLSLALAAIKHFRPSVILEQSFGLFQPDVLAEIRKRFPFVKVISMHVGFPLVGYGVPFGKSPEYDVIFTTCKGFAHDFLRTGVQDVIVVPHGFDSRIVVDRFDDETYPLVFSGSSGFGSGISHWSRYEYLEALCEKTPITCFLTEPEQASKSYARDSIAMRVRQQSFDFVRRNLPSLGLGLPRHPRSSLIRRPPKSWRPPNAPLSARYPENCRSPVFGLDMYSVLAASGITFHRGHDAEGSCSSALRLYEATGVGSMLLADSARDLDQLFVAGKEYVAYESVQDAVEKAIYYLQNAEERLEIASAGQRRTLSDHTLDRRAEQFATAFWDRL